MQSTLTYIPFGRVSYFFTGMRKQAIIAKSEKIQPEEIPNEVVPEPEEFEPLSDEEKTLLDELFNLFIETYEWKRTTKEKQ